MDVDVSWCIGVFRPCCMALNLHFHHRQCLHPTGYVMFKCFLCCLVASTCHLFSPVTKAFDENLQNNSYIYISTSILIHYISIFILIYMYTYTALYIYTNVQTSFLTQPQLADAAASHLRYRDTYPYRPMDLKFISRAAGPG